MSDAPISYRRLPGTGRGLGTYVTLWEGPDHLLMVRAGSIGERYKRFYFRDVQAIFLRPTRRGMANRIVFGALAAAAGAGGLFAEAAVAAALWIVAAIFAAVVVADLVRGQTCDCFVATPVQTERLASLRRTRKARRVLERIRPLIRQAQEGEGERKSESPKSETK